MDKNNVELFKQAINEAISNKFDKISNACPEEIICSERHDIAMRAIIYGKADRQKTWTPRMKRIIAILVAAALLLTGCGIIFHNEIRDFVENVYELFVEISFSEKDSTGNEIEQIYEPTYIPEGYVLEEYVTLPVNIFYKYSNQNGDIIYIEQYVLDGTYFVVDSETGYSEINNIHTYDVYYRTAYDVDHYLWNNGSYAFMIKSTAKLSVDELILMIDGIVVK